MWTGTSSAIISTCADRPVRRLRGDPHRGRGGGQRRGDPRGPAGLPERSRPAAKGHRPRRPGPAWRSVPAAARRRRHRGPGLGCRGGDRGLRALRRALPPAGTATRAPGRDDRRVLVLPRPGQLHAARVVAEELRDWVDSGARRLPRRQRLALRHPVLLRRRLHRRPRPPAPGRRGCSTCRSWTRQPARRWPMPFDAMAITLAHLANVLWITGSPARGRRRGDRARWPARPACRSPRDRSAWPTSRVRWPGRHNSAATTRRPPGSPRRWWRSASGTASSSGRAPATIHLAVAEHAADGRADAADVIATQVALWEFLRSRVLLPYVLTAAAPAAGRARPARLAGGRVRRRRRARRGDRVALLRGRAAPPVRRVGPATAGGEPRHMLDRARAPGESPGRPCSSSCGPRLTAAGSIRPRRPSRRPPTAGLDASRPGRAIPSSTRRGRCSRGSVSPA